LAWIALCAATAIHVADEAFTGFLAIYNPAVQEIRQQYPLLPLPTFTFEVWITLVTVGVIAMFALSIFVWQARRWTRLASYAFAGFMLLNGVLHIAVSVFAWKLVSGVYSSPLLIVVSLVLIGCSGWRKKESKKSVGD
jgi:EamA domain-containing membrane protein RarD